MQGSECYSQPHTVSSSGSSLLIDRRSGVTRAMCVCYLGDEVRVQQASLLQDSLRASRGLQAGAGWVRLLLHKVQQRLHLLTGEVQHGVQVIHHPV